MAKSTNNQKPFLGQRQPVYPIKKQVVRVSYQDGSVYRGYIQQQDYASTVLRDRTLCAIWEPNGVALTGAYYTAQLVGVYSVPLSSMSASSGAPQAKWYCLGSGTIPLFAVSVLCCTQGVPSFPTEGEGGSLSSISQALSSESSSSEEAKWYCFQESSSSSSHRSSSSGGPGDSSSSSPPSDSSGSGGGAWYCISLAGGSSSESSGGGAWYCVATPDSPSSSGSLNGAWYCVGGSSSSSFGSQGVSSLIPETSASSSGSLNGAWYCVGGSSSSSEIPSSLTSSQTSSLVSEQSSSESAIVTGCCPGGLPSQLMLTITSGGSCTGTYIMTYNGVLGSWLLQNINGCPENPQDQFISLRCDLNEDFELGLANNAITYGSGFTFRCDPFEVTFLGVDLDAAFIPSCCPGATAAVLTFTEIP